MSTSPSVELDISKLVEEVGPILFKQAFFKLRDRQLAEDLVQETFVTAVQKSDDFRGDSSPQTWLSTILRNKIIDHFRKTRPEQSISQHFEDDAELDAYFNKCGAWRGWFFKHWTDCPHDVLENRGFAEALVGCLAKLPVRFKQIFYTRAVDQLPTEEVCHAFQISETNLGAIMFRSRVHLRECLEKNWFKPARENNRG